MREVTIRPLTKYRKNIYIVLGNLEFSVEWNLLMLASQTRKL